MNGQKARVTVKREHSMYLSLNIFRVLLDGRQIGRIANAAQESFEVKPGKHKFQCHDSMGLMTLTEEVTFEIQAGEHYELTMRDEGSFLGRMCPLTAFMKKQRMFAVYVNKK